MIYRYTVKNFFLLVLLALISEAAYSQICVKGTIVNDKGVGMAGAYIKVEGTDIVTLSDLDGNYLLTVPESDRDKHVVVSFAGYLLETFDVSEGEHDVVLKAKETQTIADILVSTQKRLQSTVEVPIALSAIDSAKSRQLDLYRIDEISRFVPGFSAAIRNEENTLFGIRGVTSNMQESYTQSRISVYVDGISVSRQQASYLELFDMERVEVVKGPQGTLFGRGAEIGAVHYVRKKPTDEFSASVSAMYGNYNQRKVVGVLNSPIGEKMANRFAFDYIAHDGYLKTSDGGAINGQNAIALRNSTTFHLSDNVDFNMVLDYQHDDTPGTAYQARRQFTSTGEVYTMSPFEKANLDNASNLYLKRDVGGFLGQLDWDISEHFDLNSTTGIRANNGEEYYDIDGTILRILEGHDKTKAYQVSEELRCNWSLGDKVNGFFGGSYFYENVRHSYLFEGNLRYIFPLTVGKNVKNSLTSLPEKIINGIQQVVLQWSEPVKEAHSELADQIDESCGKFNELVAGRIREKFAEMSADWFNTIYWEKTPDFFSDTKESIFGVLLQALTDMAVEDQLFANLLEADNQDIQGVLGELNIDEGLAQLKPISSLPLTDNTYEDETDYNHTYEASAFADFSWNIYKRLYLTFGIRSTFETIKSGYSSTSLTIPMLGSMMYASSNGHVVWTEEKYTSIVGRFVVNWMINPTHNLYLSASRGRRPGVLYFDGNPNDIISLSPETTWSYELGIKGTTKYGHLSYALAFYYYDWLNFQSMVRASRQSGALSYNSDDNGKAYGAGTEMSAVYTFNPNVSLFADFAYIGGTFCDKNMKDVEQSNAGNMFSNTPRATFDMGFMYRHELSGNKIIYWSPSFYTQSKEYFNDSNTPEYLQGSYILLNANVGMQFVRDRVTYDIGIFGHNITNTKYLIHAGNGSEALGLPTCEIGYPATFNLSLRLFFK